MITLIVNGNTEVFEALKYENFGELLDEVVKKFKGMVLKEIKINDKEIPVNRVEELRNAVLDEELKIEMEFAPLQDFFASTLDDVIEYIDNISRLLDKVSSKVLIGEDEGFNNIKNLAEGISAMENLRVNAIKITGLSPSDFEGKVTGEQVTSILSDFVNALEVRDLIELSDLLEEKIPLVLEYYKNYFKNVLNFLRQNN